MLANQFQRPQSIVHLDFGLTNVAVLGDNRLIFDALNQVGFAHSSRFNQVEVAMIIRHIIEVTARNIGKMI